MRTTKDAEPSNLSENNDMKPQIRLPRRSFRREAAGITHNAVYLALPSLSEAHTRQSKHGPMYIKTLWHPFLILAVHHRNALTRCYR